MQKTKRKPFKTENMRIVEKAIGRLMRAIQKATDEQLPAIMDSFKRTLLPLIFNWLIDMLVDAVKSKVTHKWQKAAAALAAVGGPAVTKIGIRLVMNTNTAYRLRLIDVLANMAVKDRAPLGPLLRWSHDPESEEIREAARAALRNRGIHVSDVARDPMTAGSGDIVERESAGRKAEACEVSSSDAPGPPSSRCLVSLPRGLTPSC